jgi:amino acid transporter
MTLDPRTQSEPAPRALRAGAIGVPGMVAMVVGATAPITALASNLSLSLAFGAGPATLVVIVGIVAVLAVFTAGYVVLSRAVVNTGAYYAYVAFGLGPGAGAATAVIATIAYNAAAAGMAAATGHFTDLALTAAGLDLPWWLYAAAAMAATGLLGWSGVSVAARATTLISGVQFALLASLVVAVLVRGPAGSLTAATAPAALLGGGLGLSVVFVLLSFSGYEAAAAYCEEARDARRTVAVATYLALLLLGVVFLVATAAVVAAVPDVRAAAQADPGSLVFGVFATYLGAWTGPVLGFVVATSFLGATVAFHSMATRYLFALGRAGLLPAVLARTHPTRATPHVGVAVQVVLGALLVAPFAIGGADPFVGLFPAISGVTSLAVIVLMTACCASVVRAAALGLVTGSAWATRIAPVLAGAALLACGGLIVANYPDVTGSSSPWINVLPLVLAIGAAYGALAQRRRAVLDLPVERA